jgi:CheY-like chemotaxis protein
MDGKFSSFPRSFARGASMKETIDPVVLIVGEDSEFVYLIQRYVAQQGCQTLIARPEPETVELIRQKTPHAILIDIESHPATGWDILETLKQDRDTSEIPIVICSWLDEAARSLQAGATAHLRKPVMYKDVSTALANAGIVAGVQAAES